MGHQQPHHQREKRPGELGCETSERSLGLGSEGCIFFWSAMRRFIKAATTHNLMCATSYSIISVPHTQEATLSVLLKDELGDDVDLFFCMQEDATLVTMCLCCNQVWMWCVCMGLCR